MARRGFGGTALRAALGAVTGVAEGLQQRDLLAAQKQREEEAARQAQQMGIANLMMQGFEAPAVTMERQQGARQAAGSAIASALQAASGQTPTPITGDFKALSQGYAAARPDRTVTIGGQQLALRETAPEREQRLSQTKTMQETQKFEDAVAQLPAELQPIARASKVIPANLLQPRQEGMTEYQREMIRLREEENKRRGQDQQTQAKPRFGEISSLRKEFNTESRPYKTINDKLREIEALGNKPNPTPQDMEALVRAFVKVQDPTSVVRESEFKTAANTGALVDKIENYGNRIGKGEFLSAKQRADMVQTARLLREEAMKQYGQLANSYESLAGSFGMDPQNIVANRIDRESRTAEQAQKPSGDATYEAAKQAIAEGRDKAAVIARYEQGTGKKWPGGR